MRNGKIQKVNVKKLELSIFLKVINTDTKKENTCGL